VPCEEVDEEEEEAEEELVPRCGSRKSETKSGRGGGGEVGGGELGRLLCVVGEGVGRPAVPVSALALERPKIDVGHLGESAAALEPSRKTRCVAAESGTGGSGNAKSLVLWRSRRVRPTECVADEGVTGRR